MDGFQPALTVDDLWPGEKVGVTMCGRRLLMVNVDGEVRAYDDRCPHLGLPLSDGTLDGSRLVCRGHLWEYDVKTGAGINPASVRLRSVPVRVEDATILVDPRCLDDG